jgi:hypothetical protein
MTALMERAARNCLARLGLFACIFEETGNEIGVEADRGVQSLLE